MATEDTPEKKNKREGLKTLGNMFAGAAFDRLLDGTFNPIFGALVTVAVAALILLKTGILQIANWPSSAFIVLFIVGFLVVGAAILLTVVWVLVCIPFLLALGFSWIFKTPRPEPTRLQVTLTIAVLILSFPPCYSSELDRLVD